LQGAGGSGKTYCMTEVVLKVVLRFVGPLGVKAIAPHNSTARLLSKNGVRGQTMNSAGCLNREQSLQAKALKPDARKRRLLEQEWLAPLMLLIDELSLSTATPVRHLAQGFPRPLEAAPSRCRPHHGASLR
jgi:hypothetical protein